MENETWNDFSRQKKRNWKQLNSRSSTLLLYQRQFQSDVMCFFFVSTLRAPYNHCCLSMCVPCLHCLPFNTATVAHRISIRNQANEPNSTRFLRKRTKNSCTLTSIKGALESCCLRKEREYERRFQVEVEKVIFGCWIARYICSVLCVCECHCFNRSSRIWWLYVHGNWLHCISRSESFILVSFLKTTHEKKSIVHDKCSRDKFGLKERKCRDS